MPATAADIARATRRATIVEASNGAVKAIYAQARDGRTSPSPGFFDTASDAQSAQDARMGLIGVVRRRFGVAAAEMIFPVLSSALPAWTLVDAENDMNGKALVTRMQVDTEEETTTMEMMG